MECSDLKSLVCAKGIKGLLVWRKIRHQKFPGSLLDHLQVQGGIVVSVWKTREGLREADLGSIIFLF